MEPRRLFLKFNNALKRQLDLGEFRFSLDKNPGAFRFYKSQTMLFWYHAMSEFFEELVESYELKRCKEGHDGRHGVINCECGGSGYIRNPDSPPKSYLDIEEGFDTPPNARKR